MKKLFEKEILKLQNHAHVNQISINKFFQRIESTVPLTKERSVKDHLCVFFLPINVKSQSIYLIDHYKAQDWIPPGGHIKIGEHPTDTVRREFKEELSYELHDEKVELFDLTIKYMNNPKHNCKTHYDFWYLVYMNKKHNFIFNNQEFKNASWFNLFEGVKRIELNQKYKNIILKIPAVVFSKLN